MILSCLGRLLLWRLPDVGILRVRIMDDMFVGWECEDCGGPCEEGLAYCDDCAWVAEMEDDDDRQPDEAQEWYDFDPYC